MITHTPGPWRAVRLYTGTTNCFVIDHTMSGVFTEADARLIEAAPEMYEALQALMYTRADGDNSPAWSDALAALAKAEGRS